MATVKTSRDLGIITVDLEPDDDRRELIDRLTEAVSDFPGTQVTTGITTFHIYVMVDRERLEELSPKDQEQTWVGLREAVGAAT